MTTAVESICYEYSEDVLFSQDVCSDGNPVMIICYINSKYLCELSRFLHNYGYSLKSIKKFGKAFILVRFIVPSESCQKKMTGDFNLENDSF